MGIYPGAGQAGRRLWRATFYHRNSCWPGKGFPPGEGWQVKISKSGSKVILSIEAWAIYLTESLGKCGNIVVNSAVGAGVFKHGKHRPELAAVHEGRIVLHAQHLLAALDVFFSDVERLAGLRFFKQLAEGQAFFVGSIPSGLSSENLTPTGFRLEVELLKDRVVQLFCSS